MLIFITLIILLTGIIWLSVELFTSSSLNDFLDKKIMRRFLWLWLPVYALWRLSREVLKKK